jgi:proline dehydrogenase
MNSINKTVVFRTLQFYRHDRLSFLDDSIEAAEKEIYSWRETVRGAYGKERERAREKIIPPIQADKATT